MVAYSGNNFQFFFGVTLICSTWAFQNGLRWRYKPNSYNSVEQTFGQ